MSFSSYFRFLTCVELYTVRAITCTIYRDADDFYMEIFSASDTLIRPTILRPLTERQWALISPALPSFNSTLGI